ncbi:MAG: hypothetical protein IJ711_00020 [Lachnospiraceae bacterium]|nr:hypothetical protein [Clostridia bacterium]MBR1691140.1 hypothetical protein [Lachnospiraceae bacterium]
MEKMYYSPDYDRLVSEETARRAYEWGMENGIWRSDFTFADYIRTYFE